MWLNAACGALSGPAPPSLEVTVYLSSLLLGFLSPPLWFLAVLACLTTGAEGEQKDLQACQKRGSAPGPRGRTTVSISSRTPEGRPHHCPVCGSEARLEPSDPFEDTPRPVCGHLLRVIQSPPTGVCVQPVPCSPRVTGFSTPFGHGYLSGMKGG